MIIVLGFIAPIAYCVVVGYFTECKFRKGQQS